MTQLRHFDSDSIDQLPWPENEQGQFARNYLEPIIKSGPARYVDNIDRQMAALLVDDKVIPILIGRNETGCSFVCSSYSYYVEYAKEELATLDNPAAAWLLKTILSFAGARLKAGMIDKAIYVNNWLLTTNPYLKLSAEQIQAVTADLTHRYPQHAIVVRCVDDYTVDGFADDLQANGYKMVGARIIYILDPRDKTYQSRQNVRYDRKLLDKTDYELVTARDITAKDIPRITHLYRDLYLGKYPTLNPQFNQVFFEHVVWNKSFSFRAFRKDGRIDAFACWFRSAGVLVASSIGYDTQLPRKLGLYRLAMAVFMNAAKRVGLPLNMSSGSGRFKQLRGARPVMESIAVYDRHLPAGRRTPWNALQTIYSSPIFNRIAESI